MMTYDIITECPLGVSVDKTSEKIDDECSIAVLSPLHLEQDVFSLVGMAALCFKADQT